MTKQIFTDEYLCAYILTMVCQKRITFLFLLILIVHVCINKIRFQSLLHKPAMLYWNNALSWSPNRRMITHSVINNATKCVWKYFDNCKPTARVTASGHCTNGTIVPSIVFFIRVCFTIENSNDCSLIGFYGVLFYTLVCLKWWMFIAAMGPSGDC